MPNSSNVTNNKYSANKFFTFYKQEDVIMSYYDITKGRKEAMMESVYTFYRDHINNKDWEDDDKCLIALKKHCCKHCIKYKKKEHNFDKCTECQMFQMFLIYLHGEWSKFR